MLLYAALASLSVSSPPGKGPYSVQLEALVDVGGMISSIGWDSQVRPYSGAHETLNCRNHLSPPL